MKKAFSLLELIIVIVVISIISSFVISKVNDSINSSVKTKVKSEIALIRNQIAKTKTKNILLKNDSLIVLDKASVNIEKSKLFSNILDFPLISTTKEKKESGKWIKVSDNKYMIFTKDEENLEFSFIDDSFICKSAISLCNNYE